MITFLLGLPGSGKTAYAVDRIYNNFSEDKEAKKDSKVTFNNCYTNINQFKYDKVENVHPLDFEKLHEILTKLHSFTKGKNKKNDKYLLKFCRRLKIKDTLFVIDESHNNFDKKDIVLVWWLSYHRHLHHEIILITQNLSLIESKYKAFSEFFFVAKPTSLRLFTSSFKYNVFTHSRLSKASEIGSKKLKQNDKVFELYHSGDSISTTNVVLKYVLGSLLIFIFLFLYFYFVVLGNSFSVDENNTSIPISTIDDSEVYNYEIHQEFNQSEVSREDDSMIEYENSVFISFSCSSNVCSSEDITIPFQLLKKFYDESQLELLNESQVNSNLTIYYFNSSKSFYNYLFPKRRSKNEKNNKTSNSIVPVNFFSQSK